MPLNDLLGWPGVFLSSFALEILRTSWIIFLGGLK